MGRVCGVATAASPSVLLVLRTVGGSSRDLLLWALQCFP